jgi:hypothetical protein
MDEQFTLGLQAFTPLGAATPAQWAASHVATFSGIVNPLPRNVAIMTMDAIGGNVVLLRFSHQYAVGEDATLSQPATFSLLDVLPAEKVRALCD